jgi:hypothetical protein
MHILREERQRPSVVHQQMAAEGSPSEEQIPPSSTPKLKPGPGQRTHVRIPAVYQSGVTLFVNKIVHPDIFEELESCPDLPRKF